MTSTEQGKRDLELAIWAHTRMIAEGIDQKILAMFDRESQAKERRIRGQRYDVHRHEWRVK